MAGARAAVITSLIQTAKLNGHDPYAYLKDVLQHLPTQRAREIAQLLPHRWAPPARACTQRPGGGQHVLAGRLPIDTPGFTPGSPQP